MVRVQGDGQGIEQDRRGGVRAPVHRVDGDGVAAAHEAGVLGRIDGIVADGDAGVVGALGGPDGRGGEVLRGDLPPQDIGRDEAVLQAVGQLLQQFHEDLAALAEARQDEGTAVGEVVDIVLERRADIAHRHREAAVDQGRIQVGFHGHLPIVGRIEVQTAGEDPVHALHLGAHAGAGHGVRRLREMVHLAAHRIIESLRGADVEQVHVRPAVDGVPRLGRGIVRRSRNPLAGSAGNHGRQRDHEKQSYLHRESLSSNSTDGWKSSERM